MQAEEIISSVTSKCDTSEGGCHGPPRAVVNHGGGCVSHNLPRHCPSSPSALLHLNPASPPYPLDGYRTALRRRTIRLDSGMYPDELSTTSSTSGVVSSQWDGYSDTSFLSSTAATPTSTIPIPSQQPRRPQQGTPSDNDDEDSSRCVPARTCGPGQRSAAHSREARPTAAKPGPRCPALLLTNSFTPFPPSLQRRRRVRHPLARKHVAAEPAVGATQSLWAQPAFPRQVARRRRQHLCRRLDCKLALLQLCCR